LEQKGNKVGSKSCLVSEKAEEEQKEAKEAAA
jgi:hypothetical protein